MTAESVEDLLRAASTHGLELVAHRPELDTSGADFVVLQGEDAEGVAWIVRAPRRPDVLSRANAEHAILDQVRSRVRFLVPEWRIFSPEVIAYPRLSGEPAAVVGESGYVWRFDETQPPATFLDSLAESLAQLHAIDPQNALGFRVRTQTEIRATYAEQMERARVVLKIPDTIWQRWHTWLEDQASWPPHAAVVHGDLHPGHVLLDAAFRVVGILDWTEAHVGDPATDFALFYATLGEGTLQTLLEKYEARGGRVWPTFSSHIAAMWSAYPVIIADFAAMSGQEGPLALAQMLIDAQSGSVL
jgi:macrolide phosphotransferase